MARNQQGDNTRYITTLGARRNTPHNTPLGLPIGGYTGNDAITYSDYVKGAMAQGLYLFPTSSGHGTPTQADLTAFAATLKRARWSNAQIRSAMQYAHAGPTLIQRTLGGIKNAAIPVPGLGGGAAGVTAGKVGLAAAAAAAISAPLDFLKLIAWIFHPQNILRAVEFLVGIVLMIFGLRAAFQARGERLEGFSTSESALTRSDLGRVAQSLGAAARGQGGGRSGRRPRRVQSAPHATRRRALRQRYEREEDLRRRRSQNPRPKKSS